MGRRWQAEDFPKSNWRIWRWFWRPRMARGFFNMRFFWHVVILHGCAVGGGSIAYANTLVETREGTWQNGSWASLADWRSEMPVHQERKIAVGLHNSHVVPSVLMAQARETAARIYATIGVKLRWRSRPETRIWMQFDTHVPPADHPGAMGYATPYDKTGTSIHILLDRVLCAGSQRLQGVLAGYVMAHDSAMCSKALAAIRIRGS